ncbi:hypothetical protein [Halobacillus litoralis]|uniref:hypothetical protein n=1 Tax=Halobacillus litoralis TaxID=45668 RepID=UPI001CFCB4EE|nr:hypothetical protein [Halobacillus litoralis]
MTTVGILGMTHDEEMQKKYRYPLSLVEKLIEEFNPDVICGEVHPKSWELYLIEGKPYGILGETQEEYPSLIFPYCEKNNISFIPVNWFEEDVFEEEPFDRYGVEKRKLLEKEHMQWQEEQLSAWNADRIPLNSFEYDEVTEKMYKWLHTVNPDVQNVVWNARHFIMLARVKNAVRKYEGKRILCIHGADHNYWYYKTLAEEDNIELVYPLRTK